MRVARIRSLSEAPTLGEEDAQDGVDGETLVRVRAIALNPVDVACGTGVFYGGHPPLPYVPGAEAVGEVDATGHRVWIFGGGVGIARDGTLAEAVSVPESAVYDVPEEASNDVRAAASGIAGIAGWLPVTARADVGPDDTVLVLGATGTAGSVAAQAARMRGARRIVAVGRRPDRLERVRELGADATVELREGVDLAAAFTEACEGAPTVVIDFLWAAPLAAALEAAAPDARAVNVGQSAGAETTLRSGTVRGKQLNVLGFSTFALSRDRLQAAYSELATQVAGGRVVIDVETYPLEQVGDAWHRQASGQAPKVVVEI